MSNRYAVERFTKHDILYIVNHRDAKREWIYYHICVII